MVPLSTMTVGERAVCWEMVLLFHTIWSVLMVYQKYSYPPSLFSHFAICQQGPHTVA